MKLKSTLIALAALTVVDMVATHGQYRTTLTHACMTFFYWLTSLGWSMTIT